MHNSIIQMLDFNVEAAAGGFYSAKDNIGIDQVAIPLLEGLVSVDSYMELLRKVYLAFAM